jgi:FKBP-type peptidyl-prolyl cis-trans isomerase SlyD
MDDEKLCLISIGVVIVIFAGLAGMTYIDEEGWPWQDDKKEEEETLLIQEGDEVSVDYVGRFIGSAGEPGPVFDTSLPDVARDESIPKSINFQQRPTYDDLTFTVGSGQMIKGFEEAVINKQVDDSFTVAIPPEKGYGKAYDEFIFTVNATETIPMKETMDIEDFRRSFPFVDLETMEKFIHPFWGWDVNIISSSPDEVQIWQQPVYGNEYRGYDWNSTIVDISTERNIITIHHNIDEINEETRVPLFIVRAADPVWAEKAEAAREQPPEMGLVTSKGGVITIDFNEEVAGKTLIFTITINNVKRE